MEGSSTSTEMSANDSSPGDSVIRILLMGRKGSGKSSSGNTILGENRFKVIKPKKKKGFEVYEEKAQIGGKEVCVINFPDLLDPDLSKEKEEELKEQLISGCSAGLSSVLLTVPLEEPVENEEEILHHIKYIFGPEVQKFIMILFTREDELQDEGQAIDEYLQDHEDLQRLVTECGGKFHCFDNKSKSDDKRRDLLQKIEGMMEENGGPFTMQQTRRRDSLNALDANFSGDSPGQFKLTLVLLGKTGSGKSATGNSIISRNRFKSSAGSVSQTKQCQSETTVRFGKKISVIDTPGLYDTELSEDEIKTEIVKCVAFTSPGPHIFIIVIKVGRFTAEAKNTVDKIRNVFGEQILKYTMILFTHKDELQNENKSTDQFLQDSDPDLQTLLQSCGNRFFFLNNSAASFPQFKDLIRKIEMMVKENRGTYYTDEMFEGVQKIQKKLEEIVKQFDLQHNVTESEIQKTHLCLAEETQDDSVKEIINLMYIVASTLNLEAKFTTKPEFTLTEEGKPVLRAIEKLAKESMCAVQ